MEMGHLPFQIQLVLPPQMKLKKKNYTKKFITFHLNKN